MKEKQTIFWQNKLKLFLRERSWSQGKFLTSRKTLGKELQWVSAGITAAYESLIPLQHMQTWVFLFFVILWNIGKTTTFTSGICWWHTMMFQVHLSHFMKGKWLCHSQAVFWILAVSEQSDGWAVCKKWRKHLLKNHSCTYISPKRQTKGEKNH